MSITLNGTTGITTPDLSSTADIDANGSAVLTTASSLASANLTGAVAVDASGRVTMPYQPAFLAIPTGSQLNFPINAQTTVDFANEIFDQGNNFSSNTFTFPMLRDLPLFRSMLSELKNLSGPAANMNCLVYPSPLQMTPLPLLFSPFLALNSRNCVTSCATG